MQEMKVSGFFSQTGLPVKRLFPATRVNLGTFLPTLLKSLHELPVFQSQRPTAISVGQAKSAGTRK